MFYVCCLILLSCLIDTLLATETHHFVTINHLSLTGLSKQKSRVTKILGVFQLEQLHHLLGLCSLCKAN